LKTIIKKNFLGKEMNGFLQSYLKYINYRIQQSRGGKTSDFLQGQVPFDSLMDFIFFKIKNILGKNLKLLRVYTNLQYSNMPGDYHIDDGHMTCLYMVNGEGDFEIKDESKIKFEEDKLILFDAKKPHKGNAPKKGDRITLAFKTEFI
jgi:hypothetical protein|tara:strand:+ start:4118 stop:4561 length:444 start_codon:yes stop_codon:yes gene_type:complete